MKYRIDQLQVSGSHGCVSATVLSRDLFDNGEGLIALAIGGKTTVLNHADATALAEFLIAFDPKARIEPS